MDSKKMGKQIAIQFIAQLAASLIAGIILYQFFKPKDEGNNPPASRTTTRTTVVEEQPLDEQQG